MMDLKGDWLLFRADDWSPAEDRELSEDEERDNGVTSGLGVIKPAPSE
jgi:hypothetical protein